LRKSVPCLLLGVVLGTLPLAAQRFGVKGGLNFSGLRGASFVETRRMTTFRVGGFATFRLGGGFSLQPEVYYARKGSSFERSWGAPGSRWHISGKMKLDYVEMPILCQYEWRRGAVRPFLYTGPYVAFNTRAVVDTRWQTDLAGDRRVVSDLEGTKHWDLGLVAGAGLKRPIGRAHLLLDARYSFGLTKPSMELASEVRHGVFSVLVGVGF